MRARSERCPLFRCQFNRSPATLNGPMRHQSAGDTKDQSAWDRSVGTNLTARVSFGPCTQFEVWQ
jgi:hypothetical protein